MSKALETTMTAEQDHHLHTSAFEGKVSSTFVRIEREALKNLLVDHGRALALLPDGYEPPERRK